MPCDVFICCLNCKCVVKHSSHKLHSMRLFFVVRFVRCLRVRFLWINDGSGTDGGNGFGSNLMGNGDGEHWSEFIGSINRFIYGWIMDADGVSDTDTGSNLSTVLVDKSSDKKVDALALSLMSNVAL
eukprot:414208_1